MTLIDSFFNILGIEDAFILLSVVLLIFLKGNQKKYFLISNGLAILIERYYSLSFLLLHQQVQISDLILTIILSAALLGFLIVFSISVVKNNTILLKVSVIAIMLVIFSRFLFYIIPIIKKDIQLPPYKFLVNYPLIIFLDFKFIVLHAFYLYYLKRIKFVTNSIIRVCASCKKEIDHSDKYCPHCGTLN